MEKIVDSKGFKVLYGVAIVVVAVFTTYCLAHL